MSNAEVLEQGTGLEIAVIGLAGRFPGAGNVEQFWRNLRDGVESITFFSDEELLAAGVDPALLQNPNFVKARGVLEDAELFDAAFFGYNPREAEIMDPQQRVFLECAWEALENAGYDSETCNNRIGVYAGVSMNTYFVNLYSNPELLDALGQYQTFIGNDKDFISTRASYKMNLTGPSMVIQTACSTSLVAVHQACRALLSGECDMAMAGGSSVSLPQKSGYLYQEEGIMSPDGHCRAFDSKAQGTVGGNGVGIVVLKRLEDALADGDHIRAVIKGTAINNDGSLKVGYTAPSVEGQAQAIRAAQLMAEVEPETISYIETHGTGTTLGDPIEIAALTEAFSNGGEKKNYAAIGSVKTNIGHLDVAAGVAGLIKTVLALEHKQLPPSLNFTAPNPGINFEESPFYVNERLVEWKTNGAPRRAGVSSFGLGGTNAHAVLEEAPAVEPAGESRAWQLLTLSARTAPALEAAMTNLAGHLREHTELNLADVAYTLKAGRRRFTHRATLVCRDREEALAALETGGASKGFREPTQWSVVFMFPGGGAQYPNMGLDLYRAEPTYRQHVDACLKLLDAQLSFDLREILFPADERLAEAALQLRKTSVALPALFITEYALAKLWMSWGICPEALIGHSLGEYVAACLAGVFSLEDALSLVVLRGRLFEQLPSGSMLSVSLPEGEVRAMLDERLSIAAINSPSLCVVSGATEAIEELAERLGAQDIDCRRLLIDVAAHSSMVTPILDEFTCFVESLQLNAPQIPFISNVTGTWISAAQATEPAYWAKHLRQSVRFADGVRELLQEPNRMLLEVGPGQTLSMLANMQASEADTHPALNSMRHPSDSQPDTAFLLATLGKLWLAGVNLNWEHFYEGERRRRVPLPTYPFERGCYWVEFNRAQQAKASASPSASERAQEIADWFYLPTWKPARLLHTSARPAQEKECWLMFVDEDGFASSISKRLNQEGVDVFTVRMGEEFARVDERSFIVNPGRMEDYDAVLAALGVRGLSPQTIVHCWSIARETAATHVARSTAESFRDAQAKGYYSLLFLTHALERAGLASHERTESVPLRLAVISNNAQALTGIETARPEQATLVALCKVIPQEYQNVLCRSIDVTLPEAGTRQEAGLVDSLISEIKSDASERLVAYRGAQQRWAQTFEPLRLDAGGASDRLEASAQRNGHLRERGVYLITGGMGGVGLLLAKRLAQTVRARLVLAGRAPLPRREEWSQWLSTHTPEDAVSERIRKLRELEEAGAEVFYSSVDVADEAQVRALIDETYERFGALDGVFHAAGTTHGKSFSAPLSELGTAESEEQFRAKVYGAYSLAKALDGRALDFCMLFSSNSAVLGGLGFGAYAAANLFLDSFAATESRTGSTRWVSADWDGWLLSDEQAEESVAHSSMAKYAMRPQESIEALERILASDVEGSLAVSNRCLQGRLDVWLKRNEIAEQDAVAPSEQNVTLHPRPNLKTPYIAPSNEVEQAVAAIWQELLGMEQVGINDNFFELGGHSLLATRIVTQLRDAFHVKLPLRALFESPTVAQLSLLILARLAEELDTDMLASLEGLSQREVEFILAGEQQLVEERT
jgi:acyl transferase domain-containing protein/acyl carrier protein